MENLQSVKETTLQLRVSHKQKEILNQAAKLDQTTLTSFVLENAYRAAQQILSEQVHFTLSPPQWEKFCNLLDQPAHSIPALQALLSEPGLLDD